MGSNGVLTRYRSVPSSRGAPPQAEVGATCGCLALLEREMAALWLNCVLLAVCAGAPATGCRGLPRGTCAVQVQVCSSGITSH